MTTGISSQLRVNFGSVFPLARMTMIGLQLAADGGASVDVLHSLAGFAAGRLEMHLRPLDARSAFVMPCSGSIN
jgi:hypothetical protein